MLGWRVNVDHEFDVIHVHATGGDVGGHKNAGLTRGERREVAVTSDLREVSVQVDRRYTRVGQLLCELLGVVLGAHEQDATAGARGELFDELVLLIDSGYLEDVVGHRGDVGICLVDRVQHLVVEVAAHKLVNAVVERGAEQHPLSGLGGLVHDARDDGQETEVGHVVCFVEHCHLDRVQLHEALFHEVFEAAGAGHDDIDARFEGCDLALLRNSTEDGGDVETVRSRERLHGGGNLGGELAGGCQYQSEWPARAALTTGELAAEAGDHGDGEGEGLARACLPAAEHVFAGQRVGQGVELNGERLHNAARGERGDEGSWHAERAEDVFGHRDFCAFRDKGAQAYPDGSGSGADGEGGCGHIRSP